VTGDLHDATLYYTVMGRDLNTEPDYAGMAAALKTPRASCAPRSARAPALPLTPTLAFIRDTVPDAAHRMEELLAQARAADADVARIRAEALRRLVMRSRIAPTPTTLTDSALQRRIAALALPALGVLAAEPLYLLFDTAIVGSVRWHSQAWPSAVCWCCW